MTHVESRVVVGFAICFLTQHSDRGIDWHLGNSFDQPRIAGDRGEQLCDLGFDLAT